MITLIQCRHISDVAGSTEHVIVIHIRRERDISFRPTGRIRVIQDRTMYRGNTKTIDWQRETRATDFFSQFSGERAQRQFSRKVRIRNRHFSSSSLSTVFTTDVT